VAVLKGVGDRSLGYLLLGRRLGRAIRSGLLR